MCRVDGRSVRQQGHVLQRVVRVELLAKDLHGGADLLEAHAGVEEALDDLELNDVVEAVEALRSGPCRRLDRGAQQTGTRPVVELSVRDADDGAHLWCAVSLVERSNLWT